MVFKSFNRQSKLINVIYNVICLLYFLGQVFGTSSSHRVLGRSSLGIIRPYQW